MSLRTLLIAATALSAIVLPPASAGESSTYKGDCGYESLAVRGDDVYEGVLYVAMAFSSDDAADLPVSATVTCYVTVDGVAQPGARLTMPGAGAVAAAAVIRFEATEVQDVDLCYQVDYTSDDTPTHNGCVVAVSPQWPPQEVIDLGNGAFGIVETTTCEALRLLAGDYAVVAVDEQSDVYVAGELVRDCPPYA